MGKVQIESRLMTRSRKTLPLSQWNQTRLELLIAQEHKCAICTKDIDNAPHLDHCHETEKIRGVLCGNCNTGLGMFKDSCYLLDKAIQYLQLHMVVKVRDC